MFYDMKLRSIAPVYISTEDKKNIINKICLDMVKISRSRSANKDYFTLSRGGNLSSIFPRNTPNSTVIQMKQAMMYRVSGDPQEIYTENLFKEMFNGSFCTFLKSFIENFYKYYKLKTPFSLVNVNFQGVHRSGWDYILKSLAALPDIHKNKLILDTYVDKTFGWSSSFYLSEDVIPYKKEWIGFVHHTFCVESGEYNLHNTLQNPDFIESLPLCRGLYVFSTKLKTELIKELNNQTIPVILLPYATELGALKFDYQKFVESPQVIQIGGWLRNLFGIYRLEVPKHFKKCILTNEHTDVSDEKDLPALPSSFIPRKICDVDYDVQTNDDILNYLCEKKAEVTRLSSLSNQEYDNILEKSIVFLDLKDASAVNTLVECIVRRTPILINPLDPVVELLGEKYPFYYSSYYEASQKCTNLQLIKDTQTYLSTISTANFDIQNLLKNF